MGPCVRRDDPLRVRRFPRVDKTNSRVRNCHTCHLKSLDAFGLLVVFLRRRPSKEFNHGGLG